MEWQCEKREADATQEASDANDRTDMVERERDSALQESQRLQSLCESLQVRSVGMVLSTTINMTGT